MDLVHRIATIQTPRMVKQPAEKSGTGAPRRLAARNLDLSRDAHRVFAS
jgi:hypothetical protein